METVESLGGATVGDRAREHADRSGAEGIYVLIARDEAKIDVIVSKPFRNAIDPTRLRAIEGAFVAGLKNRDFDGALLGGVKSIDSEVSTARAELGGLRQGVPAGRVGRNGRVVNRGGSFGISSLLGIGLLVFGVLFVVRLLGSLFRGGGMQGAYGPGRTGAGGYSPGYGGGGGGFMSSMFGGIGGALAGNWLYDQFSGRHHGGNTTDSSTYGDQTDAANAGSDWDNGADAGGADWGGAGGDAGGGDWGGGGGGGDWGGGGDGGSW